MRDFIKAHESQVHFCIILFAVISIWNFGALPSPQNAEIEYANAQNDISRLTIFKLENTLLPPYIHLLLTLLSCLLLISTIIWAHGENRIKLALCCLIILFSVPFLVGIKAAHAFQRPWLIIHTIKADDGQKYSYLSYSRLQSQNFCLGLLESNNAKSRVYKIIGATDNNPPRTRIALVRPADMSKLHSRLLKSNDGWILGISYNNLCYFAYDPVAKKFYGKSSEPESSIYSISNFLLVGEQDELNQKDVKVILNSVKRVIEYYDFQNPPESGSPAGVPRLGILEQALTHPNKNVRELAKIILEQIANAPAPEK